MAQYKPADIDILEFAVHEFGIGHKFTNRELKNAIIEEGKKDIPQDVINTHIEKLIELGYHPEANVSLYNGEYVIRYRKSEDSPVLYAHMRRTPNFPIGKTFSDRFKRIPPDWPEFIKFGKEEFELSPYTAICDMGKAPCNIDDIPFLKRCNWRICDEPFIADRYTFTLMPNVYKVLCRMKKELAQEQAEKVGKKVAECFKKSGLSAEEFVEIVKNTVK